MSYVMTEGGRLATDTRKESASPAEAAKIANYRKLEARAGKIDEENTKLLAQKEALEGVVEEKDAVILGANDRIAELETQLGIRIDDDEGSEDNDGDGSGDGSGA